MAGIDVTSASFAQRMYRKPGRNALDAEETKAAPRSNAVIALLVGALMLLAWLLLK